MHVNVRQLVKWVGGPTVVTGLLASAIVYLEALPVIQKDFNALAAEVQQNSEDRLRDDLRDLRIQKFKNAREIREFQNKGEAVPDWLFVERADLDNEIEQVEQQLKHLGR